MLHNEDAQNLWSFWHGGPGTPKGNIPPEQQTKKIDKKTQRLIDLIKAEYANDEDYSTELVERLTTNK